LKVKGHNTTVNQKTCEASIVTLVHRRW